MYTSYPTLPSFFFIILEIWGPSKRLKAPYSTRSSGWCPFHPLHYCSGQQSGDNQCTLVCRFACFPSNSARPVCDWDSHGWWPLQMDRIGTDRYEYIGTEKPSGTTWMGTTAIPWLYPYTLVLYHLQSLIFIAPKDEMKWSANPTYHHPALCICRIVFAKCLDTKECSS